MRCTRSESTEIPWCEPLDEPDLTIGTILVNGHFLINSIFYKKKIGLHVIFHFTLVLSKVFDYNFIQIY